MSLGVDIGGTSVKFGVIDGFNNIVYKDSMPTHKDNPAEVIVENIAEKCREIIEKFPISSVGVGTPGVIDFEKRTVSASNLPFKNLPLAKMLEDKLIFDERRKKLYRALESLPEKTHTALYLVYFEELSYEETAKVMKISKKQVDNLVYRGKGMLRSILGEEDEFK